MIHKHGVQYRSRRWKPFGTFDPDRVTSVPRGKSETGLTIHSTAIRGHVDVTGPGTGIGDEVAT